MANLTYIKGVRTRYRNVLEIEIQRANDLIKSGLHTEDLENQVSNVTKCLEKIKSYSDKVEMQSEKLASAIGESDDEFTETIVNDDCKLYSDAMERYVDLISLREMLMLEKQREDSNKTKVEIEDENTTKLVQLQTDMQYLLAKQMRQQEVTNKKESEKFSSVKLPKIEMPSFNGDKTKWVEFWDSFQCSVHDNKRITNVEKFNYLKSKLSGEARSAIAGLALSNENYPIAVDILMKRFGNAQEIVDLHYNQLINLQPATNKVSSLRYLLDKVERHLRSLEVLGQSVDQDVFVSIIRSKLPEDVLIQLEIQNGVDEKWTVATLCESLHKYVVVRERAEKGNKSAMEKKGDHVSDRMSNRSLQHRRHVPEKTHAPIYKSSAQALITSETRQHSAKGKNKAYSNKCCYCQKNHWSDECEQYKTISERKDRIKGSCYKCLKGGHSFNSCKTNKVCVYCGEMNVHHRSLCPKKFPFKHSVTNLVNEITTQDEAKDSGLMSLNEMVLMQTALTEIKCPETAATVPVRLLFDSGSHRSYVSEALSKKLGLKEEGEQDIHLVTFGSNTAKKITTKFTKVDITLKNGKHTQITANIVPLISGELQRRPVNDLCYGRVQDIMKSVELADDIPTENESSPIDILIGNDYYLDFIHGEKIELHQGLYLLASKLGWILSGRTSDTNDDRNESNMLVLTYGNNIANSNAFATIDSSLPTPPDLEDFWKVESIGIIDKQTKTDDEVAMEHFRDTLKFEDNRYQVTWPWKNEDPDLPINKELAMGRLRTSVNRMKNKPEVLQKYDRVLRDQLDKGVIEKVPDKLSDGIVHYIPHHAVVKSQTTTKLRVVYDASAKTNRENNSLNECLYRGPVMLHNLCGMLMRFRMHPIAIVADIEKAFLQIGLQEDQRDVTRFMWLKDIANTTTDIANIQEYRFCRVPFGVVSSPFLLGATIETHLDTYKSDIADKIKGDIYVDNLITGTDSVCEAKEMYKAAKEMFNDGSMNLREWITNKKEINDSFATVDKAETESMKVLGHEWDINKDTLSIKTITTNSGNQTVTKRLALKQIASVFDPLGLLCPVVLRGKLFLQDLWNKKVDWDERLGDHDQKHWSSIVLDLENVSTCCIPRCICLEELMPSDCLLCFCDSSDKAYTAVVYMHQTSEKGSTTNLLFAKTRLAPVKTMSIPRLELLAVVIGVRCLKFVKEQLKRPISQTYLFTDSQCVLHWINSSKQLSVFVRNRVREIKEATDVTMSYVPTKENPADIASRGCSTEKIKNNYLWWHGPKWLDKPINEWPSFEYSLDDKTQEKCESELPKTKKGKETSLLQVSQDKKTEAESPFGIDIERFSSVTKLLRVTVLVLRFVQKLRKRTCENGNITSSEIQEAEVLWLKCVQTAYFKDVFRAISVKKNTNITRQLGIYMDDSGLLRCKGRMENACLSEAARCPILMPKGAKYTHLIIERAHKELLHSGVSQTLSSVRLRYWIPRGRATVKAVLKKCRICRRYEGGSYKMPPMCSLPKSRVTEASPFSRVGLDYMGPLYTKTKDGQTKVWICLFTCLVTRAIHLELVCDMSAAEFLLCFRRFIAEKGTPSEIISDNAAQFRAASTVLNRLWSQIHKNNEVLSYVSNAGIKWTFNVELAPWMGGFYERLVGLVKRSLRKTIGRRLLTIVQLQTLIKEIASVLNSRPLVYVGDDVNSNIPITPGHFLTINPKTGIPETEITEDKDYQPYESTVEKLTEMWKKGQRLLDMFWKLWRDEYLISLRERTQTNLKTGRVHAQFEPNINDVVLMKENAPRGNWKFGKVINLLKGRDGNFRSAKIVIPSGKEIGRPLNLLYPLEVSK